MPMNGKHRNFYIFALIWTKRYWIRTLLAFIKPIPGDPGNFQPDLVCSTEVAAVLSRHKVNQVVLNACRSAKGRKAEKNVALSIMRAGIRTCVAMSHSISASAVEVFVSALYDALLLKCIPLEAATSMARAALRIYPQRLSGFGEYVLVDDWVVPVVYSNDSSSSNLGYSFPLERSIPRLSYVNQPPFGREGDILRIESSLFITKRPVLLVGQAGMGKTYLLQHLCDWWRDTGLIVGSHYVQFSTDRIWDLHELFNNLQEKLVDSNTSTKRDGVLSHLRSNTFLLVFDSLESIDFSDRLARRRLHRELSGLLKSLHGGKTLVIITSRAREDWLSQQTVTHYLGSIGNIAGMQYIRHSLDSARAENGDPKFETLEDYQHLEQLVKLVNGNPLALNLLLQHYQQSWKRPASYLVDLLAGKPIAFSKKDFGSQESFRSLGELEIIVDSLAPQGWQNWLPGQILAPFWKILPERDLRLYVMCYTRKTSQHSGNPFGFSSNGLGTTARNWVAKMNELCDLTGESIDSLGIPAFDIFKAIAEIPAEEEAKNPNALPDLVSLDDMILADEKYDLDDIVNTPIFDPLEEQCTRILEPLKNSLFLTKADAPLVPRHLRSRDYLLVHPILPMVLRAHPGYRQNVFGFGGSARLGFTMYYTYRSMKWPWNYQYFDPIWAEYRKEIGFEFINFLSAAACFLCSDRKVTDVRVEHAFLVRMLLVVHRGMSADLGHINVMQILYNKALDFSLEQESVLVARRRLQTTIGSSSQFPARPQGDGAESSVQDECLLLCQESILFLHRLNALHAAMFVGSSYSHLNSSKQSSFQKTSERLARDLIRDGVPSGFDATYWKKVLDYYLYISSVAMRPNWRADSKALAKRQEFIKLVTDRYGTQPSLENHGSLTDAIPIALLSTACHTARIATAVLSVRRALNENRLTDAQNILDRALKMEVFEACNDLANRATLLELRSEMHEKMGEWEDALGAFDEASRLRGQLSKQEESDEITMEMIERMSRRRRLERREPRDEVQKSSWAYFLASLVLKLLWWGLYQLLLWMWRTYRKSS